MKTDKEVEETDNTGDVPIEKKKKCTMVGEESKAVNIANVAIKSVSKKLPTERQRWICRGIVVKGSVLIFLLVPVNFSWHFSRTITS